MEVDQGGFVTNMANPCSFQRHFPLRQVQVDRAVFIVHCSRYHMKRCVDSGLWVPSQEDPGTSAEDGFVKGQGEEEDGEEEKEVYEEVK